VSFSPFLSLLSAGAAAFADVEKGIHGGLVFHAHAPALMTSSRAIPP
jgi:hypothetical protein